MRKADARPEISARRAHTLGGVVGVDQNAVRRLAVVLNEVARNHPLTDTGARSCRPGRRERYRLNSAHPSLCEVSTLISERSVVLPSYAEIECQPGSGLEIVLEE